MRGSDPPPPPYFLGAQLQAEEFHRDEESSYRSNSLFTGISNYRLPWEDENESMTPMSSSEFGNQEERRRRRNSVNNSSSFSSFFHRSDPTAMRQPSLMLPELRNYNKPFIHIRGEKEEKTSILQKLPAEVSSCRGRKLPQIHVPDLASYRSTVEARTQQIAANTGRYERLTADAIVRDRVSSVLFEKARLPPYKIEKPNRFRLSDSQKMGAQSIIKSKASVKIIDKFNIELMGRDISCLGPSVWLNDEVMNFYFEMINERARILTSKNPNGRAPKCYCFSTFFFAKLVHETNTNLEYRYPDVQRWTKRKKIDIFSYDLIIFPVHVGKIHWSLGVVDISRKKINFLDSLGGNFGHTFAEFVKRYLEDEHKDKKGCELNDKNDWVFEETELPPQQKNGCDCGVFTCQYGERRSLGEPFDFTQEDIPNARLKMALEIASGDL